MSFENELEAALIHKESGAYGVTTFGNSFLVSLRVTGTGTAWRPAHREFAIRDPAVWLSHSMRRRCLGLPIVLGHPEESMLNAETFRKSIIGISIFSYVTRTELWCVARLFDEELAEQIANPGDTYCVDTSPCAIFRSDKIKKTTTGGGDALSIEGEPALLDHLAVIITPAGTPGGVWSKGKLENANG